MNCAGRGEVTQAARRRRGTALASAQVDTLRIKLLKVAAVITRNTRRIRAVPGLALAQRGHLRPRDEPTALTLNFIQRLACAMTQKWPATQAGVGVVTGRSRSFHLGGNPLTSNLLIERQNRRQSGSSTRTVVTA